MLLKIKPVQFHMQMISNIFKYPVCAYFPHYYHYHLLESLIGHIPSSRFIRPLYQKPVFTEFIQVLILFIVCQSQFHIWSPVIHIVSFDVYQKFYILATWPANWCLGFSIVYMIYLILVFSLIYYTVL